MLAARGAVGLVLLALWLYCIIDVITTDESPVRHLPKTAVAGHRDLPARHRLDRVAGGGPPGEGQLPHRRPRLPPAQAAARPEDQADFGVDLDGLSPIVREREERAQHAPAGGAAAAAGGGAGPQGAGGRAEAAGGRPPPAGAGAARRRVRPRRTAGGSKLEG